MLRMRYSKSMPITAEDISKYVEDNIGTFHEKRLTKLRDVELKKILQRKNPYLFRAKGMIIAVDLVRYLLDAYLSSQEETIFGEFLEGLAIFVCEKVYGGRKSAVEGVDLEFIRDDEQYLVTIKSGPNRGNSGQLTKMREQFTKAKKILRTNNPRSRLQYIAVNGCCYGSDSAPDKGEYFKYCGQEFWSFISGMENLYMDIVEPLGHQAQVRNDAFMVEYGNLVNRLADDFTTKYCSRAGSIRWEEIVRLNSGKKT
jgi:hypothetical protein